ncbi:hypothetical protein [Chitinophaga agrisoli]|nr:hypothetical protein [Chitinophaga agrisoli]
MEKINALIDKLQELKNSNADLQAISYYAQLLQAEVLHARTLQSVHEQHTQSQGNIAVIMPSATAQTVTVVRPAEAAAAYHNAETTTYHNGHTNTTVLHNITVAPEKYTPPAPPPPQPVTARPQPIESIRPAAVVGARSLERQPQLQPQPQPLPQAQPQPQVQVQPQPQAQTQPLPERQPATAPATLFDVEKEKAAPAKKTKEGGLRKEINELAAQGAPSLNEKLKQSKSEIGERLGEMPVKNLKQAIGINDKFQFIQELFRGDVDMYERSIKTINEFHTLQEAEYWIERELKIRQGWLDDTRTVQHFYSLVKKRFS